MSSYDQELTRQLHNSENPGIKEFMRNLYHLVFTEIKDSKNILEIGSGAGISKTHLASLNILRTDIFHFPLNEVRGGIDSHKLPFKDKTFDSSLAIDVLHHLAKPLTALNELKRVTNLDKGGKIVLIEPFVSAFSFPIYRIFHSEKTSNPWRKKYSEPFISLKPEDGDQSLTRLLFTSKEGRDLLLKLFPPKDFEVKVRIFSIFSFFITGGLSRPIPIGKKIVRSIFNLEYNLPQVILRVFGSRCIIVIKGIR